MASFCTVAILWFFHNKHELQRGEKMFLYLSFPVTVFWVSNQAEYFEEYVIKRKREIYPPEEKMRRKELEDFKERMREKREQKLLRHLGTRQIPEE
ncbi:protein PET100 homolog, mitochondrial isoform X1 [Scyliorhinus torazame]|uniref:protein PET100 homolog, mitochondrial isoform X1 n=1 Tax=Scyliorhinus torazame TaxID=75743 RepID=UPI003B59A224